MTGKQRVLVVDDNPIFVEALSAALGHAGVLASKCSDPGEVLSWRDGNYFDYDLILLDMRLGLGADGLPLNAAKLLPHLKTYAPRTRVIVFSQDDISVEECVRCLYLGALTVIPKSSSPEEISLVAKVYEAIGDQGRTREELIQVLWEDICKEKKGGDGRRLEMLAINLISSIPTFSVIGNNIESLSGEIDVLVENLNTHPFWTKLNSLQMVIECKDTKRKPQPRDFDHLRQLVKSRGSLSRVGILISTSSVTRNHRQRQSEERKSGDTFMFYLDSDDLQALVELPFDGREDYLRRVFSSQ